MRVAIKCFRRIELSADANRRIAADLAEWLAPGRLVDSGLEDGEGFGHESWWREKPREQRQCKQDGAIEKSLGCHASPL